MNDNTTAEMMESLAVDRNRLVARVEERRNQKAALDAEIDRLDDLIFRDEQAIRAIYNLLEPMEFIGEEEI